jgi:hypothetical protein
MLVHGFNDIVDNNNMIYRTKGSDVIRKDTRKGNAPSGKLLVRATIGTFT